MFRLFFCGLPQAFNPPSHMGHPCLQCALQILFEVVSITELFHRDGTDSLRRHLYVLGGFSFDNVIVKHRRTLSPALPRQRKAVIVLFGQLLHDHRRIHLLGGLALSFFEKFAVVELVGLKVGAPVLITVQKPLSPTDWEPAIDSGDFQISRTAIFGHHRMSVADSKFVVGAGNHREDVLNGCRHQVPSGVHAALLYWLSPSFSTIISEAKNLPEGGGHLDHEAGDRVFS
mmetsp:Transcript_10498/g.27545  ORF Transcript_10498/g.27545 Transcript_10498/m.27545 type:complete len:230 (+) Transcript_10498:529-1218(+)